MRALDLAGKRFGKLIAKKAVGIGIKRAWLCLCDCGNESLISPSNLRSGNSTACGKCRGFNANAKKHGHRPQEGKSKTYVSWQSMKSRCTNNKSDGYINYGAAGIDFDPRWEDFSIFVEDMGERPNGTTLDRVAGKQGYSKENCRWATYKTQTQNRNNARSFEYNGSKKTVQEISNMLGISYSTAYHRLTRGKKLHDG